MPTGDIAPAAASDVTVRLLAPSEFTRMQRLIEALNPSIPPETLRARIALLANYPTYRCAGAFLRPADAARSDGSDGLLLAGVCGLWETTRPYSGRQLEPDHVVVLPEVRSLGVGRRLMAWVYDLARAEGCETVELNAYLANTRAHAFYAADGFTTLGYHFQKRL